MKGGDYSYIWLFFLKFVWFSHANSSRPSWQLFLSVSSIFLSPSPSLFLIQQPQQPTLFSFRLPLSESAWPFDQALQLCSLALLWYLDLVQGVGYNISVLLKSPWYGMLQTLVPSLSMPYCYYWVCFMHKETSFLGFYYPLFTYWRNYCLIS